MTKLYPFMRDARYVEIVKKFTKAYKHAVEQHKWQVIDKKRKEDANAAMKDLRGELNKFYITKKKEIQAEKKRIESAYKNKRQDYTNPQEEMLRRQDFEMKIMSADDSVLRNMIKDPDEDLTKFEIDRLHVEFKQRGLKEEEPQVKVLKELKGFGREHKDDPNYQLLDQEDEFMLLIDPNGRGASVYVPVAEGRSKMIQVKDIGRVASSKNSLNSNDLKMLESGTAILTHNIQSQKDWLKQFQKHQTEVINEYIDYREKKGDPIKPKKYDDDDLRAVRGSTEHDVEVEFKYLKERYHEPDHPIYSPGNPDYDISKHLAYLRSKHAAHLKTNPDLANAINLKIAEQEATSEETESQEEDQSSEDTETDKQRKNANEKEDQVNVQDQVSKSNEVVFEGRYDN